MWSRAIRGAYQDASHAKFTIHAGDLINHANNDYEWGEWFAAGSFIHATIPAIAVPGNHEYERTADGQKQISSLWKPQFNFPENGPLGLEDQVYYVDYQGVRIIALNSNERIDEQAIWLEEVLKSTQQPWKIVTFHHPVYSAARNRNNDVILKHWKPLFDKYNVDLALQGHDHTYARGSNIEEGINKQDETGTVYVVSVSGPKMYPITANRWMKRAAENTQVYQVIEIDGSVLRYKARLVTGEVYDAFELHKQKNRTTKLIEIKPAKMVERTVDNTLKSKGQ